jgi:hypothetical protein
MAELWRRASELFWKHPALWLPALGAAVLSFVADLFQRALLRQILLSHMYHSVLGGGVQPTPANLAALQQASIGSIVLTWGMNFIRILMYVCALVITSALVRRFLTPNDPLRNNLGSELRTRAAGIFGLGLRALAIYALGTLLFAYTTRALISHHRLSVVRSPWFPGSSLALLTVALALLLAPPALRLLARSATDSRTSAKAQIVALAMGLASFALSIFITTTSARIILTSAPAQRMLLEGLASLVATVPYIVMYIALGLLAMEVVNMRQATVDQ